jgi:(E)-4-hydroxy-3-methylbut-2-enyl-diphosphate synthase
VASGNGKGQIFVKGEVIKTVAEDQIVETLLEQANLMAETMELDENGQPIEGAPVVTAG